MGLIFERENDALTINPPAGDQFLSENGSNWLWAVTAVYAVSFLAFFGLSYVARSGERVFHYIFSIALLVGTIVYYSQASDLGWNVVDTTNELGNGATRQIFWAKYVNWVVAFPAVSVAVGLLSGISWATIFYHVLLSWTWVISYLVGAYTTTSYKWGFFAFGTIAYVVLALGTLIDGTASSRRVGAATRDHTMLAGWLNLLWLLYPIAWGLSDGGNRISLTSGFIFFGILDVLMVPLLAFAFLALGRRWDYGRLNIAFTQYGRVNVAPGTFPEKQTGAPAATGAQAA